MLQFDNNNINIVMLANPIFDINSTVVVSHHKEGGGRRERGGRERERECLGGEVEEK